MNTALNEQVNDSDQNIVFKPTQKAYLHHVCLFVPDIDASISFYTKGLGLELKAEFDDIIGIRPSCQFPFKLASVFIAAGEGRYIELHPAGEGAMSPPGFPMNHLAIAVEDVDQAYAKALKSGGTPFGFVIHDEQWDGAPLDVVMTGERDEPMRMAFLQGPSGELVELYQSTI